MPDSAARKHLVFHIGDPKTGTTTIQNALAAGKVTIPGKKLLYPAAVAHNYLSEQFDKVAKGQAPGPNLPGMPALPTLAKRIAKSDADYIFLSGEHFAETDQKAFHDLVAQHFLPSVDDFRLVAYVRPHGARILSSFAERSKIGRYLESIEAFYTRSLGNRRFFYAPRFLGWRALYGDRFALRPMVRDALHEGSILDDFMKTAIGDRPFDIAPMASANESLCIEDIVLLRLLQEKLRGTDFPLRHAFGWDLAELMTGMPRPSGRTRLALHRSLAEKIRATYAEDARALDAAFFAHNPVMLRELEKSVDTAIAEPQSLRPEDYFSAEELRTIDLLAGLLVDMFKSKGTKWLPFFRARREAAIGKI